MERGKPDHVLIDVTEAPLFCFRLLPNGAACLLREALLPECGDNGTSIQGITNRARVCRLPDEQAPRPDAYTDIYFSAEDVNALKTEAQKAQEPRATEPVAVPKTGSRKYTLHKAIRCAVEEKWGPGGIPEGLQPKERDAIINKMIEERFKTPTSADHAARLGRSDPEIQALVDALVAMPDRSWSECDRGKALTDPTKGEDDARVQERGIPR